MDIATIVSIITLLVVFLLSKKQIDIATTQTMLLRRQDELLHQRARLVVWAIVKPSHHYPHISSTEIEFTIDNSGTRAASSATLQLLMPENFGEEAMFGLEYPNWYVTPNMPGSKRWEVDLHRLFFVGVPVKRATSLRFNYPISIADPLSSIKWRIAFEDGVMPHKDEWEQLTVHEN